MSSKADNCGKCSITHNILSSDNFLMSEWDWEKNQSIDPHSTKRGSNKYAHWICSKCGNSWEAVINSRSRGHGCPYCSGRKVTTENSIFSKFPELMKEWDWEKNTISPKELAPQSSKNVWWKCQHCGESWQTKVVHRYNGTGCPTCAKAYKTSFPEQALFFYVSQIFKDAINGFSDPTNGITEIDVYIPSRKIGIEYNGKWWHHNKREKDNRKELAAREAGIDLICIIEDDTVSTPTQKSNEIHYNFRVPSGYDDMINFVLKGILRCNTDGDFVCTERDRFDIWSQYSVYRKEKSISALYPTIAEQWNYAKNGDLKPDACLAHSSRKVWWHCHLGHEYEARIDHRTLAGSGCPYCSGQKVLPGFNDLLTTYPSIAEEWDYDQNQSHPSQIHGGSESTAFWICKKCGFHWQASIRSRTRPKTGSGCPQCGVESAVLNKSTATTGLNDLQSQHPNIAAEWHPYLNGKKHPSTTFSHSGKKVWWRCTKCGNDWETTPDARITKGAGCPFCSGRIAKPGESLFDLFPDLREYWDWDNNRSIDPDHIKPGSGIVASWKCPDCGFTRSLSIRDFVRLKKKCRQCK